MAQNVAELAAELARAVEITMTENVTQDQRMAAYVACEKFKEVSPLCPQAGFFLVGSRQYSPVVKHFGLQLIEYTVKFNWTNISQQEKVYIKENAMRLLCEGVGPAHDTTLTHIKDVLARIIVEMVKREWPQQWTTLLAELSDACAKGEAQTELVLMIFLRLVEDVALLQTIESTQRRKDIYHALTTNMAEIFDFFLRLIELHVEEFRKHSGHEKALGHSRVVQVCLRTLSGFVEWVSITHIMAGNGRLLSILCILLNDVDFQTPAAECLLQVVNRRGSAKDRQPLLLLFSKEAMNFIYQSACQLDRMLTEPYYMFLKKLAQVLNGMAAQLTTLWVKDDAARPTDFRIFLEAVLNLMRHASLTITQCLAPIWVSFLKHDQISKEPQFLELIPELIKVVGPKTVKVPYPSTRPNRITMSVESFASLDYDSEEEYLTFFYRTRADLLDIFRQATLLVPLTTFAFCEIWLNDRLLKAPNEITTCNILDAAYLEWDALVCTLDSVLSRILMVTERPSVAVGLKLLENCLKIESHDPLIISILLSCISSLFVFLSMSACQITVTNCVAMTGVTLLPKVLDKIFANLLFVEPGSKPGQQRPTAVISLRRHAAALMVKIALKYPLLLLPIFDQIHLSVQNLARQTDQLSNMELVSLQEALLLISNHFCDYERQNTFITETIRPASTQWMTLSAVMKSPQAFIEFVGLSQAPVNPPVHDAYTINRSQINKAVTLVLAVIKRCIWPDDPDKAQRGNFVVGYTESGNPIFRNPATPLVGPLLPHILALMKVLNELFRPEAVMIIHEGFKCANQMLESERKLLLGGPGIMADPMDPNQKLPQTAQEKMQKFINSIYESCYHLMGASGPALGRDLYSIPGLANVLIDTVFSSLEHIPDYRLRPIIRVFFKPFVYSCPPACYEAVLLPIFAHLAPFMLNRLTARWLYISRLYETGELGEDVNDTQEVIEDMLNRCQTREYIDVLKIALVGGSLVGANENSTEAAMMDVNDETSMDGAAPAITRATQNAINSDVITDLGAKLLRYANTSSPIVMTVLSALSWNDSSSCLKGTQLTAPIVRFLAAEQLITPGLASHILMSILRGIQLHGQHDSNQVPLITLGVQTYEILRPKFPNILEVLQQIPNVSAADIQKLDEKIAVNQTKGNKVDKAKKELFRRMTSQIVNRRVGELFKKEPRYGELPAMNRPPPRSNPTSVIDDTSKETGIPQLFTSGTS